MATNLLGEEVTPEGLTFKPMGKCVWINRGKKVIGYISPNGWTGKSCMINWPVGTGLVTIFPSNYNLSLKELKEIIDAGEKAGILAS
jgi:hypothetical protein